MWVSSLQVACDCLSGRIQKIRIGDAVSKDIKMTSGGSHLGSLCFIWFVNRIHVLFYANDRKLFFPVSGFQDFLKIQSDLNKLSEW
jgi:hypothetical protein